MSYNYRRNNYASNRELINNLKDGLWKIRNTVEPLTDKIVKLDGYVLYSFGGILGDTESYRASLNKLSERLETYLKVILDAIKINSRYLSKVKIKHLCDIYTVQQCCWRIRHCGVRNINKINGLWREIENRLGII